MAVPVKTVTDETPSPFSVNKPLFEEATAIKDKLRMVEGRLEKMEEHRTEVSDSVYLKVKTDYEVQLDEIREQFSGKSREIEGELRNLYTAQAEQENSLSGHQEILEEARFRHKLGEFNDKKFKDLEGQQNKEIKKYNDLLDIIKGSIKQYEGILGHPYEPGREPEKPRPVKAAPVSPVASAPSPAPAPVVKAAPPPEPTPEPVSAEEIPQDTSDFEIGELAAEAATPPPTPEPEAKAPAAETGDTDVGFEDKLSDELDMFLESGDSDYFGEKSAPVKAPEPAKPAPKAEKVSPKQSLSRTEPVEDSISTILRDIPIEEEPVESSVTKSPAEETGANIDIRETPAEASMLLIEGDLDESEFILGENTSIGRSPSNDIVLKESKVSRQHAAINFIGGNYVLVDLKSSNGVFVNGKKIEESALRDGDEVSVGSFKFQFNLA